MLRTLLLLLLTGCAARRTGDAVAQVGFVFDGGRGEPGLLNVSRPSRRALRNAMEQESSRWQALWVPGLVEPAWLDRATLDTDAWRLEIWYANHGYFDARVLGWGIAPTGMKRPRFRPVRVVGHVEEGIPSRIRTIRTEGLDQVGRPLQGRITSLIEPGSEGVLVPGQVYATDSYQGMLDQLRGILFERSYAYARVNGTVAAYPEEHAVDVTVRIDPGPASRFGEVKISGLSRVPESVVRGNISIKKGDSFSASALEHTRAQLYALRVFGVVDVVPDLSDPTSPVVPVLVTVTEAKFRELRAGPEIEIEAGKGSATVGAVWTDNNVANRLWRIEQETRAGVGVVAETIGAVPELTWADVKPIVAAKGTIELPHVLGPTIALLNEGRFDVGLETGYQYFSPSFSPTLLYTGIPKLRVSAGYRIKYFDYFDYAIDLADIEDSPLGFDITDPYLLSLLEQKAVYDGRNDPLNPTRGWYWSLALSEAGGPFGGNYQFLRAIGEVRVMRGVVRLGDWDPDLVFAGRLGGGLIWPYGGGVEATVPFDERLYLGGSSTVRGWGADRLGPYVCLSDTGGLAEGGVGGALPDACKYEDLEHQLPAGGNLQAYGNIEIRKGLPFGLTGAAFLDAGRVWDKPEDFALDSILWSVGGGLRYATPVGPIRLDVGVRLGDPEEFAVHPRWGLHLALGEAF